MTTKQKKPKRKPVEAPEPRAGYERQQADAGWVKMAPGTRSLRLTPELAHRMLDVREQLAEDDPSVKNNLDVLKYLLQQVQTEPAEEA